MTRANRLGMYADVRQVLDSALAAGGGTFTCPSHGMAVHWRQRAYKFRKLYAETHSLKSESVYDVIVLPKIPPDSSAVVIKIRAQVGVFQPIEGGTPAGPIGDLDRIAADIAAKLDKGDVL